MIRLTGNSNSTRLGIFWTPLPRKPLLFPARRLRIRLPRKPRWRGFLRGPNLQTGDSRVGGTACERINEMIYDALLRAAEPYRRPEIHG